MPRRASVKPPAASKQRRFLALSTKAEICKMAMQNPAMSPSRLAEWATEMFEPGFTIDRFMVHKALKSKETLLKLPAHCLTRKTIPSPRLLHVDAAAKAFVERVVAHHGTVSTAQLRLEAHRLLRELGVPTETMLKLTKAWATQCMQRNGLSIWQLYGEAGSVKKTAVEEGRTRIQALIRLYHPDDIFNFDETAYFCRRVPTRTIAPDGIELSGRKKNKTRVAMGVATNASGTERLPF